MVGVGAARQRSRFSAASIGLGRGVGCAGPAASTGWRAAHMLAASSGTWIPCRTRRVRWCVMGADLPDRVVPVLTTQGVADALNGPGQENGRKSEERHRL